MKLGVWWFEFVRQTPQHKNVMKNKYGSAFGLGTFNIAHNLSQDLLRVSKKNPQKTHDLRKKGGIHLVISHGPLKKIGGQQRNIYSIKSGKIRV